MNLKQTPHPEPLPRTETRESTPITFTLRIPADVHEQVKIAAEEQDMTLNRFIADSALETARRILGGDVSITTPVAILVDLDSFVGGPAINVEALDRVASALGRAVIRCSFGTALSKELDPSRQALLTRNFRHEELLSREALRLRLATEAFDINAKGDAHEFILVSGDEEFGFISSLLMRQGARVLGVGVRTPAETNPTFIRAFDTFRYYEQIDRPPESAELKKLRTDYAEVLIQAALMLVNRGGKPVGAALIPLIKEARPEASLELLVYRNWRELADFAREQGLIEPLTASGVDFLVTLSEKGRKRAEALLQVTQAQSAQLGEITTIRAAIAEILGIEIPDASVRFLIFNTVQWVLNEEMAPGGIPLVDLSYRVVARLGLTGIQQNVVYRLLNGLYRCGAFEYVANPANEYDPSISRARIPVLQFDNAFVLNLMRVRKKFPAVTAPENLATVIYGAASQKDKVKSMLTIAADPHFDRANLSAWLAKLGATSA